MSATRPQPLVCANSTLMTRIAGVSQELWLPLSMFVIAGLLNWVVAPHKMLSGLYMSPTLLSAYVYGRNHAVLPASASILIMVLLAIVNPTLLIGSVTSSTRLQQWLELTTWGGLLLVTAYLMGTRYQRQASHLRELRRAYFAVLAILQPFVSNDKYTHKQCHRVANFDPSVVESFKSAFGHGQMELPESLQLRGYGEGSSFNVE